MKGKWAFAGVALAVAMAAAGLNETSLAKEVTGAHAGASDARSNARAQYDFGAPYLDAPLADWRALIEPAPENGSSRMQRDRALTLRALEHRGDARWQLAARDADLSKGAVASAFECAVGVSLEEESSPKIAHLLRRARSDFALSTSAAKKFFQRARPFMANREASCTPQSEESLRANGAYPSGHSAIGYGSALVLAALFPERAGRILARGRSYGDSRRVCNVHWQSDVEAARPLAAATFARLWSSPQFARDFVAAAQEARALNESRMNVDLSEKCRAEAAALGLERDQETDGG